jgi:hypothetical protein
VREAEAKETSKTLIKFDPTCFHSEIIIEQSLERVSNE